MRINVISGRNNIFYIILISWVILFLTFSTYAQQKDEAIKIYTFAMGLYKNGLFEEAITKFKEVLEFDPTNVDARLMIGVVYHQMGDNYRVIKELKDIVAYTKAKEVIDKSRNMSYTLPGICKTISADTDYIWVGTDAGISRFDKEKGRWFHYRNPERWDFNIITTIKSDGNIIWVGTQKGLLQVNRDFIQQRDVLLPEIKILSICRGKKVLWILADENKIYSFDLKISPKDRSSIIPKDSILTTLICDENYLWMGTKSGVIYGYDKKRNRTETFEVGEKEIKNFVIEKNNYWAFSEGYVFCGNKWRPFDLGFPSGFTFDCLDSDGKYLVVGTKNGYVEIQGINLKTEKCAFKFQLPLWTEKELVEQISDTGRQVY